MTPTPAHDSGYLDRARQVMALAGAEVEKGLPNEQHRIAEAMVDLDYYNGQGVDHIPARPAEDPLDFRDRPKRALPLTGRVVDVLTSHTYSPGPARHLDQPEAARAWFEGAYERAGVDQVLALADKFSTLSGVCLLQVVATGDDSEPIRVLAWDASQFTAWADPLDCTRPMVVCTIDRVDATTRYRVFGPETIETFVTRKLAPGQTSGGRVAQHAGSEPNVFGVLPFAVAAHRPQSRDFWVAAPGTAVRQANAHIDVLLSDLGQSIECYLRPIGIASGVDPSFKPVLRPGGFLNLPADEPTIADRQEAKLSYLQANLDVASAWADVKEYWGMTLDSVGCPRAAVRMDQTGTASGRAIVAEQIPLLVRARQRQPIVARWERDLAKVVLRVGGVYYGRPDLLAAATDPKLALAWPEVSLTIPGTPEQDASDLNDLELGIISRVDLAMRRFGVSREQAEVMLDRVAADNARRGLPEIVRVASDTKPTSPGLAPPATTPTPAETR